MGLRQVEQGISSIFAQMLGIFFYMTFQSFAEPPACFILKNLQICGNTLAKNEEMPCSTCLKPISQL